MDARARSAATLGVLVMLCLVGILVGIRALTSDLPTDPLVQWGACPQADYVKPLSRSVAPFCCWDLLDSNILNCDERLYIQSDATVLIGSFAALMVWQGSCDDPCLAYHQKDCPADLKDKGRLLIGVRGDTSLTYVDVRVPQRPAVGGTSDPTPATTPVGASSTPTTAVTGTP